MRLRIFTTLALLTACTSRPAELDDEGGVTTAMGESPSESEGSSTESSSEGSLEFIPENDAPPENTCDPFAQDCPPGQKCVPYAANGSSTWNANKCVPVMGDQQPGEPCWYAGLVEATDDCDATSMCWSFTEIDGELIGDCVAFCMGSADMPECPPGTTCPIADEGSIALCIPSCDPLAQDCANEATACFFDGTGFSCIVTTQDIPTGEPCGYINDCAPGNLCADGATQPDCAGAACCAAYCDLLLGDAGCGAQPGTVCWTFFEEGMAPPDYENLGLCVLPP